MYFRIGSKTEMTAKLGNPFVSSAIAFAPLPQIRRPSSGAARHLLPARGEKGISVNTYDSIHGAALAISVREKSFPLNSSSALFALAQA